MSAHIQDGTVFVNQDANSLTYAPDYKAIYCNQVQVGMSPYDIQMIMSRASAPGGRAVNELVATAFLSPQEAKALSIMLSRVVRDYETQIGTIALPAQILSALEAGGVAGSVVPKP